WIMDNRNQFFSKRKKRIIAGAAVLLMILLIVGVIVTMEDRRAVRKIASDTKNATEEAAKSGSKSAEKTASQDSVTGTAKTAFTCALRKSGDASADVITTLPAGARVEIRSASLGDNNNVWYRVSCMGKSGWLSSTVLESVKLDQKIEDVRKSAISWAKKTAADDSHGYSLDAVKRWGNPDYDCSTFVTSAYRSAGVPLVFSGDSSTMSCSVMRKIYEANGFEWVSAEDLGITKKNPEPDTLKAGDILLDEDQHTAMYIGNGKMVAARQDFGYSESGDQNGKEIEVSKYHAEYTSGDIHVKWNGVLRYTGGVTDPNQKQASSN
ncbi:MAG: SH3 domain-containing protein, partial [Eubacteriales bacterium]|nr:SH3 domain-containing protein [Eubacteriales bacterium]